MQPTDDGFVLYRQDRITGHVFPVKDNVRSFGEASNTADAETLSRLPHGDRFIVCDTHGTVVYQPSDTAT